MRMFEGEGHSLLLNSTGAERERVDIPRISQGFVTFVTALVAICTLSSATIHFPIMDVG